MEVGSGLAIEELKGKNLIDNYKKIAKRLTTQILSFEGVAGLLYTGALARGFADKYSDLDIIVFLNNGSNELREKIRESCSDEKKRDKVDLDLEIHRITDFEKRRSNEYQKWDLSHAVIVFDPDERIRELIRSKTSPPKNFWMRRLVTCCEYLRWYCCSLRNETPTLADTWIDRGDLVSAEYSINYALELIFKAVFTLNREFLPAPKWRVQYSYGLRWLPSDYRRLMKEVIKVKNFSTADLHRRSLAARRICTEIFAKVEKDTGLTADSITRKYVEDVLHQT